MEYFIRAERSYSNDIFQNQQHSKTTEISNLFNSRRSKDRSWYRFALSKRIFSIHENRMIPKSLSMYYFCEQHSKMTEIYNLFNSRGSKNCSSFPKEYSLSTRAEWSENHYQYTVFASNIQKPPKFLIFLIVEDQKIVPGIASSFSKENGIFFFHESRIIVTFSKIVINIFASNIQKLPKFLIF